MNITFFSRKPNNIFFSIEELFSTIQQQLVLSVKFKSYIMPYDSIGLIKRWKNIKYALSKKGDINHITGDIHYLGIFLPKRTTILTIHDCGILDKSKGLKRWVLWFFWFYLPVRKLKYITVISSETKSRLLHYVKTDANKIKVIPNCLIGEFTISTRPFNKKKPVVLQVGITPNKNIERVAEALEGLDCKLRIIGEPNESQFKALRDFKIDYDWVSGLTRDAIVQEYNNCDLLLFVSLIEGFGLPIIEAQATGKPVITSNIGVMPDTAGAGACFVNPYDVKAIRAALLKVINDESYRNMLVDKGLKNFQRYAPEQAAKEYLELYKRIEEANS